MEPFSLIAPVANWDMCMAAVHCGASEIYLGMPGFHARQKAGGLSIDNLREIIDYCHLYGVRVAVAFNILIFEDELEEVHKRARELIELAPDAVIVQDIGLASLIRFISPEQKIFASTQMTVSSVEGIEAVRDLGISRFILARELSLEELSSIRSKTDKELEVFVHGALCTSYSGQCLMSRLLGGRSANRGECAQPCRLPYSLVVDGERRDAKAGKYLVSAADLCTLEDAVKLKKAGISFFKIEGRYKSAEYVAAALKNYQAALSGKVSVQGEDEMSILFCRGFSNGWLKTGKLKQVLHAPYSSHHGLSIGRVLGLEGGWVRIETRRELEPGDGLMFSDSLRGIEIGSAVYGVRRKQSRGICEVSLAKDFRFEALSLGMEVFLNSSPSLEKRLRRFFTDKREFKRILLSVRLYGALGEPLRAEFSDDEGKLVSVVSEEPLAKAETSPLSVETLRTEFEKLGRTCFSLKCLESDIGSGLFLHSRELKRLRQRGVEALSLLRQKRNVSRLESYARASDWLKPVLVEEKTDSSVTPALSVLVRRVEQIGALSRLPAARVFLDLKRFDEYPEAAEEVLKLGMELGICTARVLKPNESRAMLRLLELGTQAVLIRNLGALEVFRESGIELIGDHSLNVANSLSARWLLEHGLSRVTPSLDLTPANLEKFVSALPAEQIEPVFYQHLPGFHMQACLFSAYLGNGLNYPQCESPCLEHKLCLEDEKHRRYEVEADCFCRNTIFRGIKCETVESVQALSRLGIRHFRIELLWENGEETVSVLSQCIKGFCNEGPYQST